MKTSSRLVPVLLSLFALLSSAPAPEAARPAAVWNPADHPDIVAGERSAAGGRFVAGEGFVAGERLSTGEILPAYVSIPAIPVHLLVRETGGSTASYGTSGSGGARGRTLLRPVHPSASTWRIRPGCADVLPRTCERLPYHATAPPRAPALDLDITACSRSIGLRSGRLHSTAAQAARGSNVVVFTAGTDVSGGPRFASDRTGCPLRHGPHLPLHRADLVGEPAPQERGVGAGG